MRSGRPVKRLMHVSIMTLTSKTGRHESDSKFHFENFSSMEVLRRHGCDVLIVEGKVNILIFEYGADADGGPVLRHETRRTPKEQVCIWVTVGL